MGELDVFPSANQSRFTMGYQIDHVLERRSDPPIRVHNFSFSGATAEDDLSSEFSRFKNGSHDLSLEGENTVYCALLPM